MCLFKYYGKVFKLYVCLFLDNKALVTFGTVSWPRFCIQKVYENGITTKKIDQTACERTNSTKSGVRPNQEDQNYGGKSEG